MRWLTKLLISFCLIAGLVMVQPAAGVVAANTQKIIDNGLCSGSNLDFSGKCKSTRSKTAVKLTRFIRKVINILSAIVGVVAVIMIIVGGFRYITSGGNDTSVTGAKNTILYAIIGLVIVALAQIIVHFVIARLT